MLLPDKTDIFPKKIWFGKPITGVITEISPQDDMFQDNIAHYFSVATSVLKCIELAMLTTDKTPADIRNILDLPSGFGRELRAIKAAFPEANITACDITREAVDFCAKVFGAIPVYSSKKTDQILFDNQFDLIWCGSLLTHLDIKYWREFIRLFESALAPNGILIFTTHGRSIPHYISTGRNHYGLDQAQLTALLDQYTKSGFGYVDYRIGEEYGISISSPSYVLSLLEEFPKLQLLTYTEKGCDNHQDVVACKKLPDQDIPIPKSAL